MGGLGAIAGIIFSVIIGLAVGLIGVVLGLLAGCYLFYGALSLAFSHMALQMGTRFGLMLYGGLER